MARLVKTGFKACDGPGGLVSVEIVKFVQPFARKTKILPPKEKLILNMCPN